MPNFYDDSKFGVIERKWFGLTKKHGGETAAGYTLGTTDATVIEHLARHYPKGPIELVKAGAFVLATVGGGGTVFDRVPVRLTVNGANESSVFYVADAAAPYSIASTDTFTQARVDAGSYVGFETGTPQSDNGTAGNTATVTGTLAFFMDYRRVFDADGKWDT